MENNKIKEITNAWSTLTTEVLDLKEVDLLNIQMLVQETYKILMIYHNDNLVPKEISRLLLKMDEFLYFSALMEHKEVSVNFYHYQAMSCIVSAMKNGFFNGNFEYKISSSQAESMYILDMKKNEVTDYLHTVKNKTSQVYAGLKLI